MGDLLEYLVNTEESFRRARLPALYSDFRSQRTINPDGYQANVAAWRRSLAHGALAGHAETCASTPSLLLLKTGPRLLQSLESKQYGRPLALGTVLREAVADGTMLPLHQFMSMTDSVYNKISSSWGSIPGSVIWWGLRQMGFDDPSSYEDKLPEGSFVVIPNLEAASNAFESQVASSSTSPFERTFSKAHFERSLSGILPGRQLSGADFNVLLKFLVRDKGVLAYDGHVVRVKLEPSDPPTITQEDLAVASLRELIADLTHQTTALASRIDELSIQAREAVAKKNRIAALAILKSKKLTENQLQTRYTTLSQLQDVAHKLEQAADQVQLVSVMKSSSKALKFLNAKNGGVEKVAEALDDLREQMGEVDEVGNMIADLGYDVTIDVDDEFEALANEEEHKGEEKATKAREEKEKIKAQEELEKGFSAAVPPTTPPARGELKKESEPEGARERSLEITEGVRRLSVVEEPEKQRPELA